VCIASSPAAMAEEDVVNIQNCWPVLNLVLLASKDPWLLRKMTVAHRNGMVEVQEEEEAKLGSWC
jgi:hypothetical protein